MTEDNVFQEMEKEGADKAAQQAQPVPPTAQQAENVLFAPSSSGEVDYEKLSDVAVGDKVKYERENLDGQTVTVEKAQLFNADTSDEANLVSALSDPKKKYYKCNFIITYDKKNSDDVNNREYLSGAIQFVQKDGSLSPHSLWYKGAKNQVAVLWETVAKKKAIEPDRMSVREFMAFMNNKPKVKLAYTTVEYNKTDYQKNLPVEIL